MGGEQKLTGPDLAAGIALTDLRDGEMLVGHAGGEAVLLARRGEQIFAVGATCTHYSGPLGDGLLVDGTVRCPWHHACFDLRSGAALRAPALNPVSMHDFPAPAARPANSVLSSERFAADYGIAAPDWRAEVARLVPVFLAGTGA